MLCKRRLFLGLLAVLAVAVSGCGAEDASRLGQIGRMIAARAEALSGGPEGGLASGWQATLGISENAKLAGRVSMRLRWDKELADSAIEVNADGGTVELKGKVGNQDQRRRAVEVAQSTSGVNKVVDSLQDASPD
jgi:osmotically-inducible protein OsmY